MKASDGSQLNLVVGVGQTANQVVHQALGFDDALADVLVVGPQRGVRLIIQ